MKETLTAAELNTVFQKMSDNISKEYLPEFKHLNFKEKLKLLESVLAKEGYEFTVFEKGDTYQLINNTSCPFFQISKKHLEICRFDKSFIAKLLSISEERITHSRNSENHCTFYITRT